MQLILKSPVVILLAVLLLGVTALQESSSAFAAQQEDLDIETILQIRDEGLNHSQVMDHLSWLADV